MPQVLREATWPRGLTEDGIINGSIAWARHALTVEQMIRHLLGQSSSRGGSVQAVNATVTSIAVGASHYVPLRLMPCARDIEVWYLADSTAGDSVSLAVISGSVTVTDVWQGAGMGVALDGESFGWRAVTLRAVGNGKPTAHPVTAAANHVQLRNDSASAAVSIYAVTIRQLANSVLEW